MKSHLKVPAILTRSLYLSCILAALPLIAFANDLSLDGQKFEVSVKKVKGPAPTVLISHGSDCSVGHPLSFGSKVNQWGFNAVILDHCFRRGLPPHVGSASHLSAWDRSEDIFKAAIWVKAQTWHEGKIAAIGFSQGGAGVISAANRQAQLNLGRLDNEIDAIDAFVSFYGGCDLAVPPDTPSKPFLVHHGEVDELALLSKCPWKRPELDPKYEVHIYINAGHAFDVGTTATLCKSMIGCVKTAVPDTGSTTLSYQRTEVFLKKQLAKD